MLENTTSVEEKGRILVTLPFDKTISFLIKELKNRKRTPYLIFFLLGCIISLIGGFFLFRQIFLQESLSIWLFILSFLLSFVFLILITPIHELIHGIAFRMEGAKKIRYGVMWKSLAAYAVAVDFECNYKQFQFIALAPLFIISIFLIAFICMPLLSSFWIAICFFVFFQHYTSCIGDILLLSYFYRLKGRNIVAWDDVDNRVSYFIEKD